MKKWLKLTVAIVVVFSSSWIVEHCMGQESSEQVASQPNTSPSLPFATLAVDGGEASPPMLLQIPVAPSPIFGSVGPSPYGGFTMMDEDQNYSFLHDPSVRKDLEFVGEQYKKYQEVLQEYQNELKVLMPEFSKHQNDPQAVAELQRKMGAIHQGQKDAIREILLPHQQERYRQVSRQMKVKMFGPGGAFQHGFLTKELGITNEQRKDLKKIQQDYQKELAEKTKELKAAAEERVMDALSSEQKEKLKELMGDDFKRDPNDWRSQVPEVPSGANESPKEKGR